MTNENFKTLRKDRGFSQAQMAARQNVVRQTVSKWENSLSVPEAEMSRKKILGVSAVILIIVFICAIYVHWNDLFYYFGKNL